MALGQRFVEWAAKLFYAADRFSRRRLLLFLAVALLPVAIRLVALLFLPIPEPHFHDEFAYLLGADTFASGRLTNPAHPMWKHFEGIHENFQPTYMSKYPPAQSLFMALGQKVLGHPWFGVVLSFGVMCGCLCWMLQGWMPTVYALLGTIVAMAQFGIFGYWMNSYWGGAVPAIGGALVLGAMARLARRSDMKAAIVGSFGAMLLANSRPFEGLVTTVAAIIGLLWWRHRRQRPISELFTVRTVVPSLAVCGLVLLWVGYYNFRVTGHPLVMPYVVHSRMYAASPQFYFLPPGPIPEYRHEIVRRLWVEWTRNLYLSKRRNPVRAVGALIKSMGFYISTLVAFAILACLLVSRSDKVWLTLAIVAALCLALLTEAGLQPHYFAPAAGLLFVPLMYSIRLLRVRAGLFGPALVLLLVILLFVHDGVAGFLKAQDEANAESSVRSETIKRLTMLGGRHLVIVRYGPAHWIHRDWVYNAADIDGSPVVWARDMGEERNQELLEYYRDRRAWLLEPDLPTSLAPYSGPPTAQRP
jgi:hypothetical protein